jgi:DNA repair protein RecN (Recombination protein N)
VLSLLKIRNIALIEDLTVEFGPGLNILTGETGSGKSIIVDSLGLLTGDRVSSDLIKSGCESASIEGLFSVGRSDALRSVCDQSGIVLDGDEVIVRRELSLAGRNRVFINGQIATQAVLRQLGELLVDIHGQGEQTALYDVGRHLEILDSFTSADELRGEVSSAYRELMSIRREIASLAQDESEKLQLVDILRFQVDEIEAADLRGGEDVELEEEKLRLANVEKLTALATEAADLLYEDDRSAVTSLDRAERRLSELASFESKFTPYLEQLISARAVAEDLGTTLRDYRSRLEFSPDRLDQIEERLAGIARLKRKYGGSIAAVLAHLRTSKERLENIELADLRKKELEDRLATAENAYREAAARLNSSRNAGARELEKRIVEGLAAVALDKSRFEIRVEHRSDILDASANGSDRVEFFFSANPGEEPRPLNKIASGGEASRIMLVLKTSGRQLDEEKTAVFDEIDVGIGGRVAEAVGRKLKTLSQTQQVFCVTHQPQIASLADVHLVVEKAVERYRTAISIRELSKEGRVEEIARMLAGEHVTDAARENARAMLKSA